MKHGSTPKVNGTSNAISPGRVEWLDTVPEAQAFDEVGLFGNQNTVCRPHSAKWRETVERLKEMFPGWDARAGGSGDCRGAGESTTSAADARADVVDDIQGERAARGVAALDGGLRREAACDGARR